MKYNLYMDILRWIYIYKLEKHFVITFEGKKLRKKINWEQSYNFMNKQWDNFAKTIKYNYYERYTKKGEYAPYIGEEFTYILLPRAQKTGYCHYHILVPDRIEWKFLNKKRKKYQFGYLTIKKNKSVAEYLNNDYFKDHEWIIPYGIRHYRTSRNIKINKYKGGDGMTYYTHETKKDFIEKDINEKYSRTLPFEEYIKDYLKITKDL